MGRLEGHWDSIDGVRGLNAEVFALREIRKPLKAFEEVSDSTRTLFFFFLKNHFL